MREDTAGPPSRDDPDETARYVGALSAWLDARHGPGAYIGTFLTGTYFAAPVPATD